MPKRLPWMRYGVPSSLKQNTNGELAQAFKNAFDKHGKLGGAFPTIHFHSKKRGKCTITNQLSLFSKGANQEPWLFFSQRRFLGSTPIRIHNQHKHFIRSQWRDLNNGPPLVSPPTQTYQKASTLILEKNRNRVNDYNCKVIHHLTTNYKYIHGSEFPVEDMVRKIPGQHLHRTTGRAMNWWQHGQFKHLLRDEMEFYIGLIVGLDWEAYSTQTCNRCGRRHKVGSGVKEYQVYHCRHWGYVIHRDVRGARGIGLKVGPANYKWVADGTSSIQHFT
ncbi:hypothetical protein HDV00_000149 [Rhizophlyctis rosea]|nr:hypothetical protein HDV00_000149 [Rhizophlyctis rosea]